MTELLPFRRILRQRILDLIKKSGLVTAVYDSRIKQLGVGDTFPCALVYAMDDVKEVAYQRDNHNYQSQGNIELIIQIVAHASGNDWPEAVEKIEEPLIQYLNTISERNRIHDCIKFFTLSGSSISVDPEGDTAEVSCKITFEVQYNTVVNTIPEDEFLRLGYDINTNDNVNESMTGIIELREDE